MNAHTLSELLQSNRGAARSITYYEGEQERRVVRYAELHERALGILHHLQQLGARPGDRVLLFLANNEAFIDAFWAGILGGIIPVPVAPGISDEHRHKLLRIAAQLGAPFLYTERRLLERIRNFAEQHEQLASYEQLARRSLLTDDLRDIARAGRVHAVRPADVAFIQYSSGSTSAPKGIVLTHANLIANLQGTTAAVRYTDEDVGLSWMPLTHDMGLIGMHIFLLANRANMHQMTTELFVRRPVLWLQLAAELRATILCSPNFGYRHYLKVLGERTLSNLDLSHVRLLFNGAEPISLALCDEFMDRCAPARLARNAMFPVYGLAEACVAVSFPPLGSAYHASHFDRHRLTAGQNVAMVGPDDRDALTLVAVGGAIPQCELRVASDTDQPLAHEQVGHIQIRGANVTAGYLDAAEANAALYTSDGWLRTGDLGAIHDNELYITGRHKEILFVNGQNYYPHDLEAVALDVPGIELGKIVVSGVHAAGAEGDELVAFVLHRGELADFLPLARQVARRIGEHAGLEVGAVVPVRRIPKTTSGKVQRHLLEEEYLSGANAADLATLRQLAAQQGAPLDGASTVEAELQAICDAALAGKRIGAHDSLFDVGVSSLKLVAIHEQLEQRWPGAVDVTDIFDHPSIAELARLIQSRREGSGRHHG
ncbi:MAG TPA: non-ribosomal peptide synthetase [Steroidobacteraceae bacterium]|nr:non-ribosomal peptide synthetase [Steroidobacteraceae bacterium]